MNRARVIARVSRLHRARRKPCPSDCARRTRRTRCPARRLRGACCSPCPCCRIRHARRSPCPCRRSPCPCRRIRHARRSPCPCRRIRRARRSPFRRARRCPCPPPPNPTRPPHPCSHPLTLPPSRVLSCFTLACRVCTCTIPPSQPQSHHIPPSPAAPLPHCPTHRHTRSPPRPPILSPSFPPSYPLPCHLPTPLPSHRLTASPFSGPVVLNNTNAGGRALVQVQVAV